MFPTACSSRAYRMSLALIYMIESSLGSDIACCRDQDIYVTATEREDRLLSYIKIACPIDRKLKKHPHG